MQFECRTVSLSASILNNQGAVEPLCNTCTQADCDNPIRKKRVSVFGKNVDWHVFVVGDSIFQVIECAGYSK